MFIAHSFLTEGKQLLILGLSHRNVERLMDGQPIYLTRESHGMAIPADIKIAIFVGETEESMAQHMSELIGPTTVIDQKKPQ